MLQLRNPRSFYQIVRPHAAGQRKFNFLLKYSPVIDNSRINGFMTTYFSNMEPQKQFIIRTYLLTSIHDNT